MGIGLEHDRLSCPSSPQTEQRLDLANLHPENGGRSSPDHRGDFNETMKHTRPRAYIVIHDASISFKRKVRGGRFGLLEQLENLTSSNEQVGTHVGVNDGASRTNIPEGDIILSNEPFENVDELSNLGIFGLLEISLSSV